MIAEWTWPPSWLFTLAASAAVVLAPTLFGEWRTLRRNRASAQLRGELDGILRTTDALTVGHGAQALIVTGDQLAVIDGDEGRVTRRYEAAQVEGLKVFDGTTGEQAFCLALPGGARSRRISTALRPEFYELMHWMFCHDKRIEFIAE